MSRTLYLIENDVLKNLSPAAAKAMTAELKDIIAVISRLAVKTVAANGLPSTIDFTDSIVMLVANNDDVATTKNSAETIQQRAVQAQIDKQKLPVRLAQLTRTAAQPEGGGIGWHNKDIIGTVGVCMTGGIASLEYIRDEVLTAFAPDRLTVEEAKTRRDKRYKAAAVAHGQEKTRKEQEADAAFAKVQAHWKLAEKNVSSWPQNLQEEFGKGIARVIAHEARHQYIAEHFDGGGLGGESAELYGVEKSTRFLEDDVAAITAALKDLEAKQKKASPYLETFPNRLSFALNTLSPHPWIA